MTKKNILFFLTKSKGGSSVDGVRTFEQAVSDYFNALYHTADSKKREVQEMLNSS